MTGRWRWVFGLSIDDDIGWGAARVNSDPRAPQEESYSFASGDLIYGRLAELRNTTELVDLQSLARSGLERLKAELPLIFRDVEAVGVSTIGLADQRKRQLRSIARKNWVQPGQAVVLDFNELFDRLFGNDINSRMGIQNDATARCLAEYQWQDPTDKADSLFLAMFSQGVNGGIINKGVPIAGELHQELGHVWPPLHEFDQADVSDLLKYSGCPRHGLCYEGVSSGARVQKQWGAPLHDLGGRRAKRANGKESQYEIWDIFTHYISHFCWTGALAATPQRILISGFVAFPEMISRVRKRFSLINEGRMSEDDPEKLPYLQFGAMDDPSFIREAAINENADILGALEVARLTLHGHLPGTGRLN
jgi:predicted NBD/HSP70 family sugar kinase